MRSLPVIRFALAVGLTAGAVAPALAAEELATGTATYDLYLDPSKPSLFAGLSGRVVSSVSRTCNAYHTSLDLVAEVFGTKGNAVTLETKSITVEDGDTLQFDIQNKLGGEVLGHSRGSATRTADGLKVTLEAPAKKTIQIKGPALFPVEMVKGAFEAAKNGKTFHQFSVFDGSGHGSRVWAVSAVIGAPRTSDPLAGGRAAWEPALAGLRSWPITFTYFPSQAPGESVPAFQSIANMFENGFANAALYDFSEFATKLKLIEFKPSEPTGCATADAGSAAIAPVQANQPPPTGTLIRHH